MFKLIKKLIKVIAIIIAGLFALIFVAAMFSDGTPRAEETVKPTVEQTVNGPRVLKFGDPEEARIMDEARATCAIEINLMKLDFSNKENKASSDACVATVYKKHNVVVDYGLN